MGMLARVVVSNPSYAGKYKGQVVQVLPKAQDLVTNFTTTVKKGCGVVEKRV